MSNKELQSYWYYEDPIALYYAVSRAIKSGIHGWKSLFYETSFIKCSSSQEGPLPLDGYAIDWGVPYDSWCGDCERFSLPIGEFESASAGYGYSLAYPYVGMPADVARSIHSYINVLDKSWLSIYPYSYDMSPALSPLTFSHDFYALPISRLGYTGSDTSPYKHLFPHMYTETLSPKLPSAISGLSYDYVIHNIIGRPTQLPPYFGEIEMETVNKSIAFDYCPIGVCWDWPYTFKDLEIAYNPYANNVSFLGGSPLGIGGYLSIFGLYDSSGLLGSSCPSQKLNQKKF